jgi:ankyrin repeat protein
MSLPTTVAVPAAAKGHAAIIEWLIKDCRTNPNVRNNGLGTPLHAAAMAGHLEPARMLCRLGVDTTLLNSQGNQARDEALHYEFAPVAQGIDHFTLARKMLVRRGHSSRLAALQLPWWV